LVARWVESWQVEQLKRQQLGNVQQERAAALAIEFRKNFEKYSSCVNVDILSAAPVV
jgi:hypothetical protein